MIIKLMLILLILNKCNNKELALMIVVIMLVLI